MNAIERPDYARAVKKIARQVRLYVSGVWPYLEKQGGVPDLPMNRKAKGESSPAIPEMALEMVDRNRVPSAYFRFYLEFFENSATKTSEGVRFSEVLKTARESPADVGRWISGDTEEARAMKRAFVEVSERVAKGVLFVHPKLNPDDIWVVTDPKDPHVQTEGSSGRRQSAAQDRQAKLKAQHAKARRLGYARLVGIRQTNSDATEMACRQMLADQRMVGLSTVRDDVRFAERNEWPDGSPVAPEHRWEGSEEQRRSSEAA